MRCSGTCAGTLVGWILACTWAGVAAPVRAQQIFGPGGERPELDGVPLEPEGQGLELPPVPTGPAPGPLSSGLAVAVHAFAFEGSTVFSDEELARLTSPYTGRAIRSEELLAAANAVTNFYVAHGYATSGALVPDQAVEDGVVRLRIVEGRLAAIEVTGNRWMREGYFRDRLARAGAAPVDVARLERALRRLQRGHSVERLEARLEPGERLGESVLHLDLHERRPMGLVAEGSNARSPAIGAAGGHFEPSLANLLGHADVLSAGFDLSEGLFEWDVRYELPVNSYDTLLELRARRTDADVVEEPFDDLGIHSDSSSYGIGLSHPLVRSQLHEVWLRAIGERRELETCLEILPPHCEPFSFLAGQPDPKQEASVLRAVLDWTRASAQDVVAVRSTASTGLDALGATTSGDADGQFFAWLGQLQWAHRLPERWLSSEWVVRGDLQLAGDPLLTLEKFAIGGRRTVRGYRENELVRDNGVLGSLELRVPVFRTGLGRPVVQLVPFADIGHGWDERSDLPDRTLASLGAGVRVSPWPWLEAELFWGGRLKRVPRAAQRDSQDDGIHFRLTLTPFDALTDE